MTNLETLVVPTDLGEWLQSREIGYSWAYFTTINALYHYWESVLSSPTGSFITDNKKELIEVILGTREYRIEEPLYCALIKGYELLDTDRFYWIYDKYEKSVSVSKLYSLHDNFLTEMSKSQWNELGINDSNAEFRKVGYEVEKEKLYIVQLPTNLEDDLIILDADGDIWKDSWPSRYKMTEKRIKEIDERFWPFAEPVE